MAGPYGASVFDGRDWHSIYAQVTLEEIAVKDTLEKQSDALKDTFDMLHPDTTA